MVLEVVRILYEMQHWGTKIACVRAIDLADGGLGWLAEWKEHEKGTDEELKRQYYGFTEDLLHAWEHGESSTVDGGKNEALDTLLAEWNVSDAAELFKEQYMTVKAAWDRRIDDLTERRRRYNCVTNSHVKQLLVEQLRAYTLQSDPFDQKHHLFCFTNATFDLRLGAFVPISKFDYCQMNCGKPWIEPTQAQRDKVAALFESILPKEDMRRGYVSVLKSGFSGTRPEHFTLANGGGRNGKGVLNENAVNCAGHYAYEGNLCLLTQALKGGPNPELANLHRRRLCIFSEPEDGVGEPLRLSNIKKLTGCDEVNARACHSNVTKTELHATSLMECNKQPKINGEKGEASVERVRLFPFEMTFTDDAEKLRANPDTYRPKDESLKTPEFKEAHRCAFFEHIVQNGGDAPYFPPETKALGTKYLAENDDLSLWVQYRF